MSWKVQSVLQQRLAMIHRIEELKRPAGEVAKEFGVSRKTANKWLARHRGKQWCALIDQSHRPKHSPDKTADAIEMFRRGDAIDPQNPASRRNLAACALRPVFNRSPA